MNDALRPHATVRPARSASRWLAALEHALLAVLVLFAVEQLYFPISYAARFVSGLLDYARFAVLCAGLAAISALLPASWAVAFRALAARLEAAGLSNPRLGRRLQSSTLLLLGAGMALCQDGEFLHAPSIGSAALFLLPGVAFWFGSRLLAVRGDGARYNASALFGVALCGWYLAHYETLNRFRSAAYGMSDEALLRAVIDLGVPTGLMFGCALFAFPFRGAAQRRRVAAWLAGIPALFALHWINATQFVDLHLPVHTALLLASTAIAWRLVPSLRVAPAAPRTTALAAVWPCLGLAVTLALAPRSNAGYLAAQHGVVARFGMELVFEYGARLDERVRNVAGIVNRAALLMRKRPLPAGERSLPSTFARPVLDPLTRADVNGAVLFFLDMKRARDIAPRPDRRSRTPRIDRCFDGGFRFAQAYSSSTRTLTVFATIYSSTYAGTRGQTRPDLALRPYWFDYQNGRHNLLDTMHGAGLRTIVLTNRYYLRYLRDPLERPIFGAADRIVAADETHGQNPGLLAALAEHPDLVPRSGRFLLIVHIMSHDLEQLPGVDRVVGEVCKALARAGRLHDTALMLTADHGVQFGEHGRQTYGRTLFQEELHVPLLWRIPGRKGGMVRGPVSALDHFPTLLDLFQIEVPFALEGRSYARAFRGEPLEPSRPIFFEVRRYEVPSVGVAMNGMKLIRWARTGAQALFSLARDPGETRNLIDDPAYHAELDRLDRQLTRFVAERY